jgi:hypothetical protein
LENANKTKNDTDSKTDTDSYVVGQTYDWTLVVGTIIADGSCMFQAGLRKAQTPHVRFVVDLLNNLLYNKWNKWSLSSKRQMCWAKLVVNHPAEYSASVRHRANSETRHSLHHYNSVCATATPKFELLQPWRKCQRCNDGVRCVHKPSIRDATIFVDLIISLRDTRG